LVSVKGKDGKPDLNNHVRIEIRDLKNRYFKHPDADLVAIFVAPEINQLTAEGKNPFVVALDQSLIMSKADLESLMPVEQILTVGYPGMMWDEAHNLPVFHRGYSATAPYIPFNGRNEFLVDIATWQGSSGSPVFLFNDNGWMSRTGTTMLGGMRLKLIGVVCGVGV
jgi:hypothetical protein